MKGPSTLPCLRREERERGYAASTGSASAGSASAGSGAGSLISSGSIFLVLVDNGGFSWKRGVLKKDVSDKRLRGVAGHLNANGGGSSDQYEPASSNTS